MHNALGPVDGRYEHTVDDLREHLSEAGLIRARIRVELQWLLHLSEEPGVQELQPFRGTQVHSLWHIMENVTPGDIQDIDDRERGNGKYAKGTNHDVKAMMNHLEEQLRADGELDHAVPFLHFGLTGEDVNNLSYGIMVQKAVREVMVPQLSCVVATLEEKAAEWMGIPLMGMTHGQPATRTTVGEQLRVFADRLDRQLKKLESFKMQGKFGGAVGNYHSIGVAYPEVDWKASGREFVEKFDLEYIEHSTQINAHDDLAELSNLLAQINTISTDLARDMWLYISRGVFKERPKDGETGSSTMTHKVNPIDWENAEGNLGVANALLRHFAEKLPISRMQRDLSDSTVQRNIGTAFGHTLIAWKSMMKGLGKVSPNREAIDAEFDEHPEIFGEAVQLVLRRYGDEDGYKKLAELTRGKSPSVQDLVDFVEALPIPEDAKDRLIDLLP